MRVAPAHQHDAVDVRRLELASRSALRVGPSVFCTSAR
jgi:hypothetical protein